MVDIGEWDGLDWEGYGYFDAPEPLSGDVFPERVAEQPWKAFAVALARAKIGDFRFVGRLLDVMDGDADPFVEAQFSEVLADAAPDVVVDEVERRLRTEGRNLPGHLVLVFCDVVGSRGRLSDVPSLIDAYFSKAHLRDADSIPILVSDMLEEQTTELATPGYLASPDTYRDVVRTRQQEMAAQLERADALVYRGREYSVERLARRALADARSGRLEPDQRRKFEAATGINCSSFFKKGQMQPLRAAALLEEFLQTGTAAKFRAGRRYFFGHLIP